MQNSFLFRIVLSLALFLCGFVSSAEAATVTMQPNKVWGPTNGLVGMWTFNGPDVNWTTNTALDRSGQGNNGTMYNMATKTSPVAGKLSSALKFDGSNDYLDAGNASSLKPTFPFTVSGWVYPVSSTTTIMIATTGDTSSHGIYAGYSLYIRTNGSISAQTGIDGASCSIDSRKTFTTSAGIAKLGSWQHVVAVFTNINDFKIYKNGVQISASPSGLAGAMVYSGGSRFRMGSYYDLCTTSTIYSNERLDDVRIYNRILTPTEITQLYHAGQVVIGAPPAVKAGNGLVGWWTFNGPDINWTTNTAIDRSGQGNNGLLVDMATKTSPVAGKLGQGLKFDGVNDYVNAGMVSAYNVSVGQTFALSAWIKATPGSVNTSFLWKEYACTGWSFSMGATGKILWRLRTGDNDCSGYNTYAASSSVSYLDNKWHHVVGVIDRPGLIMRLYVDGSIADTRVIDNTYSGGNVLSDFRIGTNWNNSVFFPGVIDDVRIYNRILSAQEIKQLAGNGIVTVNTCVRSTVKDADGNVYDTIQIGKQCWMKQNMRVGTRINVAGNQTNNAIFEKYCYNDLPANCTGNDPNQPDGGLYQWDEAMQYSTTPGARGICPSGWHIPTHDEFTTLERAVCTSSSCASDFPYDTSTTGNRGTNEGTKLKPNGTSGFEANLSGGVSIGVFFGRGVGSAFWSSLQSGGNAWYRYFFLGNTNIVRNTNDKSNGWSVRCLKD